jgi:hypothetical protein
VTLRVIKADRESGALKVMMSAQLAFVVDQDLDESFTNRSF